jgi:uncharacterized protein with HEPN domain
VRIIADTSVALPAEVRSQLPEIDWKGWSLTARRLHSGVDDGVVLWRAVTDLIPATLSWLRLYKHNQPNLFDAGA